MTIWSYDDPDPSVDSIRAAVNELACRYCDSLLTKPITSTISETQSIWEKKFRDGGYLDEQIITLVRCCPVCGWWTAKEESDDGSVIQTAGGCGILQQLDLSDQTVPLQEIRRYLVRRFEKRFSVDPSNFERVVASVYSDLGFTTRVTGRTGDNGIDVVLEGPDNRKIGVQVKRYMHSITVEQIREFVGALVINDLTKGVYVTTSTFQRGAQATVDKAACRGHAIELVDGNRFLQALGIAQRNQYFSLSDPTAPFNRLRSRLTFLARRNSWR
jgi:hypothetical protein